MVTNNAIKKFIEDFKLRQSNGVVVFPAKINFNINGHTKQRYSEIQIVTSASLDTVYLLNKDLKFEALPDVLKASTETFKYIDHKYLLIKTNNSGNFIEVYPMLIDV
ncbi:MAG TPA: hypothetical protein VK498_15655 [Ferruginibacter sp.]|nr:hypothetical protein [Ferruginibacter sp.]